MNAEEIIRLYAAGVRDFTDAQYDEVNLDEADLSGVNLSNSNLSCGSMIRANLNGANLSNTDLSDANLTEANLKGANLNGANLNHAYLYSADLENTDLRGVALDYVEYDETTKFPGGFDPSSSDAGIWLSADTFIKYERMDYVEIAKNWDRFYDAMAEMGLGEEVAKILGSSDDDRYSYKSDIKFNDIEIRVSDLTNLDWDYLKIGGQGFSENIQASTFLFQIEDAIECGEVKLILFLYT